MMSALRLVLRLVLRPALGLALRPVIAAAAAMAAAIAPAAVPAVLIVGSSVAMAASAAAEPAAPLVPIVEVRLQPVRTMISLDASFEAIRQSTVAAQVSGTIVQLPLTAGDVVRAGQVIAQIDTRDAEAAFARARAAVAQAQAEQIDARAAWERSRALVDRGFLSAAALDAAQARLAAAKAAQGQADAAARQVSLTRDFTTVRAPWDGVASIVHANVGDLAAPGVPIAVIHAPGQIRAVAQVPLSLVAAVRTASDLSVRLPSGEILLPARRTLVPEVDPVAQTRELRLEFAAAGEFLAVPGQRAEIRFTGDDLPRRMIPQAALLQRGELQAVYVARGEHFVLRAVRAGLSADGAVEILAGLHDGESVAVDAVRAGLAGARPHTEAR